MNLSLLPVFLVGLAGSVHCAGMCGGIVGALSVAPHTVYIVWQDPETHAMLK